MGATASEPRITLEREAIALFSMGRMRVLPSILAYVRPRFRSPRTAVVVQLVVGVVATLWLGSQYDDPFVIATAGVIGVIPIYLLLWTHGQKMQDTAKVFVKEEPRSWSSVARTSNGS
jgi:hypothetical protein